MTNMNWRSGLRRGVATAAVALGLACAGGSALAAPAVYLDAGLKEVAAADWVRIADPKPVQLIFQFQTKGAPNARATKMLKDEVTQAVRNSGLFSDVVEGPTPNGAILSITINEAVTPADMRDYEAQGFLTGFTFGLVASDASERYDCTAEFVRNPTADKLTRTQSQTLYFEMGLTKSAPPHATRMDNAKQAVITLARQLASNALNDLAGDPAFNHSMAELPWPPPPAPAVAAPSAAPAAASATLSAEAPRHAGLTPLVKAYR